MSDLFAARSQMAISLAFHILFAVVGIGMPLLMVVAERRWLATKDPIDLELAKRWSKGTAILFAVGAVSGTVLSFELGLLWPRFMQHAGPIFGMPFSLEGFAFFLEARPGCYFVIGNGEGDHRAHGHGEGPCTLHNPNYDFNDELIPLGATAWVRIAEEWLKAPAAAQGSL